MAKKKAAGPTIPGVTTAKHVREMTAKPGWLLPQIQIIDSAMSGRWSWWIDVLFRGEIGSSLIPQIGFNHAPSQARTPYPHFADEIGTGQSVKAQFLGVAEEARRQGYSLSKILEWFLYGLEAAGSLERPQFDDRLEIMLYQDGVQSICRMMGLPGDWGADIMQELVDGGKTGTSWFPTPGTISQLMIEMQLRTDEDIRAHSVNDPCCGTGVMLIYASNHCLDLYGNDIDPVMVGWTRLQGYLFAPWMVYGDRMRIKEIRQHRSRSITKHLESERANTVRIGKKKLAKRGAPKKAKRS